MATRGRKPRKRSPGAGSAVKVRSHKRSPRGANRNKPGVTVSGYARGKPKGKKKTKGRG